MPGTRSHEMRSQAFALDTLGNILPAICYASRNSPKVLVMEQRYRKSYGTDGQDNVFFYISRHCRRSHIRSCRDGVLVSTISFQLLRCPGPICFWAPSRDIIFSTRSQCTLKHFLEGIREANIACGHTLRLCVFITCVRVLLSRYVRPCTDEYRVLVFKYVCLRVVLEMQLSGTKGLASESGP